METEEGKLGNSVRKRSAVVQTFDQKHHLVKKGLTAAGIALWGCCSSDKWNVTFTTGLPAKITPNITTCTTRALNEQGHAPKLLPPV